MSSAANKALDNFLRIYDTSTASSAVFDSPMDWMRAMQLDNLCHSTAKQYMLHNVGMNELLIDELVAGVTRCNYEQNASEINALCGLVSVVASGDDLSSIITGNEQVPQGLLAASGAQVHLRTPIVNIERVEGSSGDQMFRVLAEDGSSSVYGLFDAVVIAAPLEFLPPNVLPSGVTRPPRREFMHLYTTVVRGELREEAFKRAQFVLTSEDATASPVMAIGALGDGVVKFFSKEPLSEAVLKALFTEQTYEVLAVREWYPYPKLVPVGEDKEEEEKLPKFKLADGLYYGELVGG